MRDTLLCDIKICVAADNCSPCFDGLGEKGTDGLIGTDTFEGFKYLLVEILPNYLEDYAIEIYERLNDNSEENKRRWNFGGKQNGEKLIRDFKKEPL